MNYSIKHTNKLVSKFAYFFLVLFSFLAVACESDNDDNPLARPIMSGYIADTSYWFANGVGARSFGKDSLGKDTILTIAATSVIDASTISIFIPYPAVGSFSVAQSDSTNKPVTTISYKGKLVPSGTINITRFDTLHYILEADFNFSFEGLVKGDSGRIDTTAMEFTKGNVKTGYLRRKP